MCINFLASVRAPKGCVWKTPFSGIEAVAKVNKRCRVFTPRMLPVEHDLPAIRVARPFVEREYASKFTHVRDVSQARIGQPIVHFVVEDQPRAKVQARWRYDSGFAELKRNFAFLDRFDSNLNNRGLRHIQPHDSS